MATSKGPGSLRQRGAVKEAWAAADEEDNFHGVCPASSMKNKGTATSAASSAGAGGANGSAQKDMVADLDDETWRRRAARIKARAARFRGQGGSSSAGAGGADDSTQKDMVADLDDETLRRRAARIKNRARAARSDDQGGSVTKATAEEWDGAASRQRVSHVARRHRLLSRFLGRGWPGLRWSVHQQSPSASLHDVSDSDSNLAVDVDGIEPFESDDGATTTGETSRSSSFTEWGFDLPGEFVEGEEEEERLLLGPDGTLLFA